MIHSRLATSHFSPVSQRGAAAAAAAALRTAGRCALWLDVQSGRVQLPSILHRGWAYMHAGNALNTGDQGRVRRWMAS